LQIQEKLALRILEQEEGRMYDAMYEAERLKKEQRCARCGAAAAAAPPAERSSTSKTQQLLLQGW
jgi:hypothetical protein